MGHMSHAGTGYIPGNRAKKIQAAIDGAGVTDVTLVQAKTGDWHHWFDWEGRTRVPLWEERALTELLEEKGLWPLRKEQA